MRQRPVVYLFDIDGTLLSSGGAGRRAMERAFGVCCDRADACTGFSMAGMTDRGIVRLGLRAIGTADTPDEIDRILATYLDLLVGEIASATDYRLHEGVREALDCAAATPRSVVGLGTGNVRAGAAIKLGRAGIYERFSFGGFGCDDEDRAALLAVGAERGASLLGLPRSECRVVVIGDTPRDIASAHAIGAEAIAVATGGYSLTELSACQPRHAFASLADPGALAALACS